MLLSRGLHFERKGSTKLFTRLTALQLLSECTGDEIWSLELCQQRGIPAAWIEELEDCFESDFSIDSQTIYEQTGNRVGRTNQYEGIRDVDLAMKLGTYLDLDVTSVRASSLSRADLVRRLQEEIEEG